LSVLTCAQKGARIKSATLPTVCGISSIDNRCYQKQPKTHDESTAICSAAGLRLCLLSEFEHGVMYVVLVRVRVCVCGRQGI
jgi:hypothetical protein